MSHNINITRIKAVSNALEKLQTPVVFVGGATVSLYADIAFREAVRPTDDVDVLIEIVAYRDYAAIEERLRAIGFTNDTASKIICRYKYHGLIVDIMPTDGKVLGFSNKWYVSGFKQAIDFEIDKQHIVQIFPLSYFIASKLEAYKSRGKNDGRTSTDFEDIIFVLNNRKAIWQDLHNAEVPLRKYLQEEFTTLLNAEYFDEWVAAHLNFNELGRVNFIIGNLAAFVNE